MRPKESLLGKPDDSKAGKRSTLRAVTIVAMLLAAAFVAIASITSETEAYTARGPILIDGDSNFIVANGVLSGSGLSTDPWIINGWSISGYDSPHLIHIRNTNAYYVIANVSVGFDTYNTGYAGIYLENAPNGRVENSTVYGKVKTGIHVYLSPNVKVNNNTVTNIGGTANDRHNIFVESCTNDVRVISNNVSSGSYGVYFKGSLQSSIEGNNISNTAKGAIVSFSSRTLTIEDNTMADGGINIWTYGVLADTNTHTITYDNLVNGKPVYYASNSTGVNLDGDSLGQIILANCSFASISNIALADVGHGILSAYCDNVTITDSQITNATWHGVSSINTQNLTVADSALEDCQFGIYCYIDRDVNISGCRISGGANYGIYSVWTPRMNVSWCNISDYRPQPSGAGSGIHYQNTASSQDLNAYITYNVFYNNLNGVVLSGCGGVHVNHNDFIANTVHATDNAASENYWDDGVEGNFWDNYTGDDIVDPIGIGDDPFKIDDDSYDYKPLMNQAIPEFGDVLIPVIAIVVLFAIMTSRKRKEPAR